MAATESRPALSGGDVAGHGSYRTGMQAALAGIRVLDFGRYIAGPWCGQLLQGFGAEVIRIERPGGAEDRAPLPLGEHDIGAYIVHANRGKRSMTLNPTKPAGREIVGDLLATADVVVANLPDDTLAAMGLDWPTVSALNPRLVLATATTFGTTGPYAGRLGFDGIGQVMAGGVHLSGLPGVGPLKTFYPWVDFLTATNLAMGVIAALFERTLTGRGKRVEGALLASALNTSGHALVEEAALGLDRLPSGNRHPAVGPADILATADGHVLVQVIGPAMFARWAGAIGRPELVDDPRFATDPDRGANGAALSAIFGEWCAGRTTAEVLDTLAAAEVPGGPVLSPRAALADPHIASTMLTTITVPGGAPLTGVAHPLADEAGRISFGDSVTALGADTEAILADLGRSPADIADLRAARIV